MSEKETEVHWGERRRAERAMPHYAERRDVAYFMRRLYKQGLTTTSGGNISARLGEGPHAGQIALTPAALDKARTRAGQVGILTLAGENLTPELRATSEYKMHLEIYKARPDAGAIVHAHPPTATAFTAARTAINTRYIAEAYYMLGTPAMAKYALTGTDELAGIVAEAARGANVILLENHGVTAIGRTLLEAFDKLELVEAAARMTLTLRQLEGAHELTPEQCAELDDLKRRSMPGVSE